MIESSAVLDASVISEMIARGEVDLGELGSVVGPINQPRLPAFLCV
jgi:hypothetical protein